MTSGYRIKEVAELSGFTAPTLRYYEEIGLLPQPPRSASGYRTYDERTLERLAFIARAKQLGCRLDEIADLTTAWDGGRCGPIQDQLRILVGEKLATAQSQMVELMTLSAELQRAAALLERHRSDGPCDEECGCMSAPAVDISTSAVSLTTMTGTPTVDATDAPIACTLEPDALPERLDQWRALLGHARHRAALDHGVRVEFDSSVSTDELSRLARAEQRCCSFFRFAITVDSRGIGLEVAAPDEALPIVHSLFGTAAS